MCVDVFDDDEENKLIYSDKFRDYTDLIGITWYPYCVQCIYLLGRFAYLENYLERRLLQKVIFFSHIAKLLRW